MDLANKGLAIDLLGALTIALVAPHQDSCDAEGSDTDGNHQHRSPFTRLACRLVQQL